MDDALIKEEAVSPERASLLPGEDFFVPDSVVEAEADEHAATVLEDAAVVVVADPDADGLVCTALIREADGAAALLPTGPHELRRSLDRLAEHTPAGCRVYICDLCPDSIADIRQPLREITNQAQDVYWFDHHRWESATMEAVRNAGVELTIGESENECSADVAFHALDHSFDSRFEDLVQVTRDHDLWLLEDPRSDDIADFAYWADPEEFVAVVREHGADLPADIEAFLEEKRVVKQNRIDRAVRRAEYREVGDLTLGVTYGRCAQNEVAERLREEGADASVIVKPAGSASLRGTEQFDRCHEVARRVNGGGHPKAAGCKPRIYEDMLDYAHHWTTQGAGAKLAILNAFHAVLET